MLKTTIVLVFLAVLLLENVQSTGKNAKGKKGKQKVVETADSQTAERKVKGLFSNCLTSVRFDTKSIRLIGEGPTGSIYHAYEIFTGEMRTLQRVKWRLFPEVINEYNIMRSLKHPNIVEVLYFYLEDETDCEYLIQVTPYYPGVTVHDLSVHWFENRLPESVLEKRIAYILRGIVQGLAYMHDMNIIHRDLKAANVLIGADGEIKIFGFYYAVQLESVNAKCKNFDTAPGSIRWEAPEVAQRNPFGQKADVWSLGMSGLELATGTVPYAEIVNDGEVERALKAKKCPQTNALNRFGKETLQDFLHKTMSRPRPNVVSLENHMLFGTVDQDTSVRDYFRSFDIGYVEARMVALRERDVNAGGWWFVENSQ